MRSNLKNDPNGKFIQWCSLSYMAGDMRTEVERRCNGEEAVMLRNRSAVSIDRMRKRIERALANVECPEYQ